MQTRLRLAAGVALFAALAAPLAQAQQDTTKAATKGARGGNGGGPGGGGPGGGGPGGFGGGPGGFGGGPGGFGGGPGGRNAGPANDSAERLLQIAAVQDDLKVDDKTKAKLKSLGEDAVKERTKRRETVTKTAAAAAAKMQAEQNAMLAEQLAANGIAVDPRTLNGNNNNNGGQRGRGGNNGGPGGPGGPGGNNQMERQMMAAAMTDLASKVDAAMLKLLDTKQKGRLKQIQLQLEGSRAFTDPNQEVAAKLDLSEEQITEIRNATGQLRQGQRQAMMDLMAQYAPADDSGNANNGGGNNNGGRGGRGGGPNFQALANLDPATRAKYDEANQKLQTQNNGASMAAIGNLLTATQKKQYNAMIGAAFDLAKLRTPPPGTPGAPATPAAATVATKPETPAAKSADASTAKPASKTKSLREQRGGN
jgi:hypothetical protein